MKQLLGMARQKKNTQSQIKKPVIHQPQQMQDQEDYESSQLELLGYAQFIGIKIPQEIELLPIAKEGMEAPLPPDWQAQETDNEQILYYNKRTGQRTEEHPCDQYYRQLVIRERKKRQKSRPFQNPVGGIGQINQGFNLNINHRNSPQVVVQPPIDPLVKMQQQKRLKKLQQQKKNQFQGKKKEMIQKFEDKKQKIQKEHRGQQQKMKNKYDEQQSSERKKVLKKMSERQRQNHEKNKQILNQFQKQSKKKLQREINDKRALQKDKIDRRIKQKKEEIRIRLENEFKKSKRLIDEQYQVKLKEMQGRQKNLIKQGEQQSLQNRIQKLKQQIVRRKMKQHAEQVHEQRRKQQGEYEIQLKEMLRKHEQKVGALQSKKPASMGQKSSMEQLIKQVEAQQKIKMRELKCQLQVLRQLKRVQNQERAQQIKMKCQEAACDRIKELSKQQQRVREKYRERRYQQYQQQMWEAEKRAKQEYLRTLRTLQQKYEMEQEIAHAEASGRRTEEINSLETNSIEAMERFITNLNWDEKQLRKQLEHIQNEIETLKSKETGIASKLTQNQIHLYKLIQDKIRNRSN